MDALVRRMVPQDSSDEATSGLPGVGLEPTRITPADFKSAASANSATPALADDILLLLINIFNQRQEQKNSVMGENLEATTGFEPVNSGFADRRLNHLATSPIGAEDEIRTRDPLLGKEMLYH